MRNAGPRAAAGISIPASMSQSVQKFGRTVALVAILAAGGSLFGQGPSPRDAWRGQAQASPQAERASVFVDSEGAPVPQRQVRHCGSRADDHTVHWYKDARDQDLYCPGGPETDPVVLVDGEKKPVRRSQARHCGSSDAEHESHWYKDRQERELFCGGGAARGGRIDSERPLSRDGVVARDDKGGPVLRRELQHCGLDYDHGPHWYGSRRSGHDHWCPGGPHRHQRGY